MMSKETLMFIPQVHISLAWLPAEFRSILDDVRHAVAQLVEALRYEPEGHGFDSLWCQWNFSLT